MVLTTFKYTCNVKKLKSNQVFMPYFLIRNVRLNMSLIYRATPEKCLVSRHLQPQWHLNRLQWSAYGAKKKFLVLVKPLFQFRNPTSNFSLHHWQSRVLAILNSFSNQITFHSSKFFVLQEGHDVSSSPSFHTLIHTTILFLFHLTFSRMNYNYSYV